MKLPIKIGEYLWTEKGTHICDEFGLAKKADEDCEVEIEEEHAQRVIFCIEEERKRTAISNEE